MKFNSKELAHLSDQPCVIEGRLNYRKCSGSGGYRSQTVFKERWFRLIKNYLFYFKIGEMGNFDSKSPAGVFIMENSSIQMEHGPDITFSFSISFIDEPGKRHMFMARSEDNVVQWVMKLRECSYEYLRNRLHLLQSKLYALTGKDPLLLVPRNEGARLWAPSIPIQNPPTCTVNPGAFSCHLHSHTPFTLERSKSDLQAHHRMKQEESRSNTKFYTDNEPKDKPMKTQVKFHLERSLTSNLCEKAKSNGSLFDKHPHQVYSRAAPSPPVRTRSISSKCRPDSAMANIDKDKRSGMILLDVVPVPPRRKVSPRVQCTPELTVTDADSSSETNTEEDLIKFE